MEEFIYPDVLDKSSEMYKNAKRISSDSEIFNGRKALLEKHFNEHPIYLDSSYYTHHDKLPRVKRYEEDFVGECWTHLSNWRDCHYYSLMDYNGHRFYIMTGGRYD